MIPHPPSSALDDQPPSEDGRCVVTSMAERTHDETGNDCGASYHCGQSPSQPLDVVELARLSIRSFSALMRISDEAAWRFPRRCQSRNHAQLIHHVNRSGMCCSRKWARLHSFGHGRRLGLPEKWRVI